MSEQRKNAGVLKVEQVRDIRRRYAADTRPTMRQLAVEYDVSVAAIHGVVRHRSHKRVRGAAA